MDVNIKGDFCCGGGWGGGGGGEISRAPLPLYEATVMCYCQKKKVVITTITVVHVILFIYLYICLFDLFIESEHSERSEHTVVLSLKFLSMLLMFPLLNEITNTSEIRD